MGSLGGLGKTAGQVGQDLITASTNPIGGTEQLGGTLSNAFKTGIGDVTGTITGAGNRATNAVKTVNPQLSQFQNPVTQQQLAGAAGGVGNSLQDQQNLLAALQAQNGTGIQSAAANSQQGLVNALQNNGGIQAQQGALSGLQGIAGQQAMTAGQLQGIASGRGPNPAMAALNQATGQNQAMQAALMASQRGAGSNVGLLARQAAQQGAATQQQAVGQGATMQAQQQLNALSGLTAQQQAQVATQAQMAGIGQGLVGQQQGAITGLANQGNQLTGQQMSQVQANNAAQQAQQNALLGAQANYNQAQVSNQASINAANAATNQARIGMQSGAIGGGMGALGALGAAVLAAHGGEIENPQHMAAGGSSIPSAPQQIVQPPPIVDPTTAGQQAVIGPQSSYGQFLMNRSQGQQMAMGGQAHDLRSGGKVNAKNPSEKAKLSGDNEKNDSVPAMLSEHEIVIPRSITLGKDPIQGAARFVAQELAKRGKNNGR